jgi:hypothetical protein
VLANHRDVGSTIELDCLTTQRLGEKRGLVPAGIPVRDELILELARLVDDDSLQGCPELP